MLHITAGEIEFHQHQYGLNQVGNVKAVAAVRRRRDDNSTKDWFYHRAVATAFNWSVEYFRERQMKQNEADELGSTDYNGGLLRCESQK